MQLPEYVSVHLVRSPLQLVATQITFEEVGTEVKHAQARQIQRLVGGDWSTLQSAPQVRTTITPGAPVNEQQRQAYRLSTKDQNWSLVINPDSLIIETRQYLGWADMAARISSALVAVAEVFDPAQALRIGLRYIDQVPMPPERTSWVGLIPDSFLGLGRDASFEASIIAAEQRHLLEIDDEIRCFLRHGAQTIENGEQNNTYLLDFDVSREGAYPFDVEDMKAAAERLHAVAGSMFRLSVEDALYEWLRGDE